MKEKALVTGGAGFIGSHIVDFLIENNYDVVVIDDLSTGRKENLHRNAKFYHLNITNIRELEKVFKQEKPDYVIHEAAQISVSLSVREPLLDARTNIFGSLNLLQCCVKCGVKGVVFASSGGTVYGEPTRFPVNENHPLLPLSPYGISKVTVEHYLNFYQKNYNLDYIALRYGNVYGPRQDPYGEAGVIAIFIQKMLKGERPTINGDGDYIRDYVYVKDVARANLLAIKNLQKLPEVSVKIKTERQPSLNGFNLGTEKGASVNELFALLKDIMKFSRPANYGPARPGDLRKNILNCQKIQNIFGWKPQTDLSSGLKETVNWFKKVNY
ncbi:MAG: NAD-dependent epimerase/dehydratase family protein [Candidatus Caldatribacteriota bacterium]|nr:NAD-dependent epimerase/dehydratase family protein [Candidatus Caldatribacteriota bacterium]